MTHLSELQFSMLVDNALTEAENLVVKQHVETCVLCQAKLDELLQETQLIKQSLCFSQEFESIKIPALQKPVGLRGVAMVAGITGSVAWLSLTLWQSLFSGIFAEIFSWFASIHISDTIGLTVTSILYFSEEGTTMLDTMFNFLVYALLFAGMATLLFSRKQFRGAVSLCLMVMVFSCILPAPSASALELRFDEEMASVTISEDINDTLVVGGDTTIIDGNVNGDLIAFGRRVIINGDVSGNLIVFTESVTISGRIEGSVIGFASTLEMASAVVGNDFWGFTGSVLMNTDTNIAGNATVFSNSASIAGEIGRDLTGFAQNIELSGRVGEDIEAFTQRVSLIGDAYVGGDITIRSSSDDALQQSPSAVVLGVVEILEGPDLEVGNKYASGGFYFSQALRLLTSFLAGIALLWFFPSLRQVSLSAGSAGLKTGGIGLLAVICTPILLLVCAVTIVGLPFAMVGVFAWVSGLYFAKIVTASIIGRLLIKDEEKQKNHFITLLAGLAAVIVVVNIPGVGGILSFVMTLAGLGILVQQVLKYSAELETDKKE